MSYRDGAVVQGAVQCLLQGLTCRSALFKVSIALLWAGCLLTPQSPFHLVSDLNSIMIIELYLHLVVDLCFVLLLLFFPYFINEMDIVLSI